MGGKQKSWCQTKWFGCPERHQNLAALLGGFLPQEELKGNPGVSSTPLVTLGDKVDPPKAPPRAGEAQEWVIPAPRRAWLGAEVEARGSRPWVWHLGECE